MCIMNRIMRKITHENTNESEDIKKYDLHVHPRPPAREIFRYSRKKKLDGFALIVHNFQQKKFQSLDYVKKVRLEGKKEKLDVVVGTEIKTELGHVVGLFINEPIRTQDFFESIDLIKEQGALVVLAHPFSFPGRGLKAVIKDFISKVDGIETFNARNMFPFSNQRADKLADKFKKAKIGVSDAHFKVEMGYGYTIFNSRYELRKAILKRQTQAGGSHIMTPIGYTLSVLKLMGLYD